MSVFTAEENPKTHYFQGDMMLTHHQQHVLHALFNFASKKSDIENRAMIKDMARLWPGGKIPYAYAEDIGEIILNTVLTTRVKTVLLCTQSLKLQPVPVLFFIIHRRRREECCRQRDEALDGAYVC